MGNESVELSLNRLVQRAGDHPFATLEYPQAVRVAPDFLGAISAFPDLVRNAEKRTRHVIPNVGVYGADVAFAAGLIPRVEGLTRSYLYRMYEGLNDPCIWVRDAANAGFRIHAREAGTALRRRLGAAGEGGGEEFSTLFLPDLDRAIAECSAQLLNGVEEAEFVRRTGQFYLIGLNWSRALVSGTELFHETAR